MSLMLPVISELLRIMGKIQYRAMIKYAEEVGIIIKRKIAVQIYSHMCVFIITNTRSLNKFYRFISDYNLLE